MCIAFPDISIGEHTIVSRLEVYAKDSSAESSNPCELIKIVQKSHVRQITGFGLGKAASGSSYPSLYIIGVVNGQYGIFRSVDNALSWQRINDDEHQFGKLLHIAGDMQDFGRVYIGTHGRGTITGIEN